MDVSKNMTNVLKHMKPCRTICKESLLCPKQGCWCRTLQAYHVRHNTRYFSEFLQNTWTHDSTSSLSNSMANLCFMYMFHSSYESNLCGGFIPAIFQAFFNRRNQGGSHKAGQAEGHSEPAHTSAPSSGCMLLLGCGWTSTELIFCFTLATNSVRNRSHI